MDWIAFLNIQGALGDALGGGATSFDGPSNPSAWNDLLTTNGTPVSGLDVLPTFAAGAGFAVTIGAGSGYLYTSVGIGAGESTYRTIYWTSKSKTLANPDGSQPRIDAVTVAPAAFGTESTIAVVTGTPATPPLAPAAPAGSGVLFYVLVPAATADSTAFRACRGIGRRVGYPWSGMTGVLAGAELSWDYTADPASTDAGLLVGVADQTGTNATANRVLIDGELLEWVGYGSAVGGNVFRDVLANPFSTTAPAGADRPYYVYACGGRHNPFPSYPYLSGSPFLCPVAFVESTTPPNPKTGKPTANMNAVGVTIVPDGAVYIGLAFVVRGTTRRRACVMDGEMTYAFNPMQELNHTFTASGRDDIGTFSGGAMPAISTKMFLNIWFAPAGGGSLIQIWPANFPAQAGAVTPGINGYAPDTGSFQANYVPISFSARLGCELWASAGIGAGVLHLGAMGFNHRVRRLVPSV